MLSILRRRTAAVEAAIENGDIPDWLRAGLQLRGWAEPEEEMVSGILRGALSEASTVTDGFEAGLRLAAIDWAVQRAMDFDIAALTISDVATVLHRVPTVFQRWTWETKPRTSKAGAEPRRSAL